MDADVDLRLAVEPANSVASAALQQAFFDDIAARYPGWEPGASQSADPSSFDPPRGAWIVAYVGGRPIGCGGLQPVDDEIAEVRRIFLDITARGRGLGRALLTELEDHARRVGYTRIRLTTGDRQAEALGLFQSVGYHDVAPFTDGAFTSHWMEKRLVE